MKDRLLKEIERLEWKFIEAKLCADGKTEELANLAKAPKERRIFAETKSVNSAYYKPIFALQK